MIPSLSVHPDREKSKPFASLAFFAVQVFIMKIRIIILLLCFAGAGYLILHTSTVKPVPIKTPLEKFPRQIGDWKVVEVIPSPDSVVQMLGVTDYINYEFVNPDGEHINFYVGYYHAVGVDGAYHSPKNCLPGGGWGIASEKKVTLPVKGGTATVTEMIIQNGPARQIVLYWYQNRGRIIASEYWEKIYLVLDALLRQRRDGAFVRIMAPCNEDSIQTIETELKRFAAMVLEELERFLPGAAL